MIPYLRVYDASIFNYLKYEVIPVSFTERLTGVSLIQDPVTGGYYADVNVNLEPAVTSVGRGWALFDEVTVGGTTVVDTNQEQTNQVTVTGPSSFDINYPGGVILNPDSTPTSVDFSWYYVSVIQGWPGTEPPPLPIVALDIDQTDKAGFQLGGGTKDSITGSVYVFATSEAEKKDITDVIYQAFFNRSIPVKNWHEGTYLDFDGTYTGFVPTQVSGLSKGMFSKVTADLNGPRFDWSEVNRHRSKVNFVFEVYKD
jgi:hypothetical protein